MRKLSAIFVFVILAASCGPVQEEVTVNWFLKPGQQSSPAKIQTPDFGKFVGKEALAKVWENKFGENSVISCQVNGGYIVSSQKKSVFVDAATGKSKDLPAGLACGATDGSTVWGHNGMAWAISDNRKLWTKQVAMGADDRFAIANGCLMQITPKSVSRIDQTNGKAIWTLELSTGNIGIWRVTDSFVFVEASGWVFRIVPDTGEYIFLAKYGQVQELFTSGQRFAVLADDKVVLFEQYYSSPILTMGDSNKKINRVWLSGESMLILTDTGYHFGKIPTELTEQTKQTFKSFTYNAKDKMMTAFAQVLELDGGNFAIVQGNLVAAIGPDVKKDIWYAQLPVPSKEDVVPKILSISKYGVLVVYQNTLTLWK